MYNNDYYIKFIEERGLTVSQYMLPESTCKILEGWFEYAPLIKIAKYAIQAFEIQRAFEKQFLFLVEHREHLANKSIKNENDTKGLISNESIIKEYESLRTQWLTLTEKLGHPYNAIDYDSYQKYYLFRKWQLRELNLFPEK